ncbi:mycothiol system anti-sigma-R factor [Propionimicrobium lymphophilum]|uniref:TIGR02949 family anti-sigma factor n=1 Tax=Propionimicrobium lymphophilum ACS-093-V-SCH5 TaxID=883161 RepID=S2VYZ1_9ACTN|nr:mycothiol system anti-sigma-R factor [Propionimicrobium lymphophilum]EPD32713.1 TIGR02949 family anti-sigma factor [Propionimicrobium lymphophilum ACS-093-V-SCH5]MDK7709287.1 mycothiol system anti-sigma-R factor [Propionimicrobium lymphophilum]MDK7733275.1 mycothiol system anti-sigma-R factor [Propionimicrobium lymphophilum]
MSEPQKTNRFESNQDLECELALSKVYAFLHGELTEETADQVRQHLMNCENCMDYFDVEALISSMLRKCCREVHAPKTLRAKLSVLHVTWGAGQ